MRKNLYIHSSKWKAIHLFLFALIISTNFSCSVNDAEDQASNNDFLMLEYLEAGGFDHSTLEFKEDIVLYDGCAAWHKHDLMASVNNEHDYDLQLIDSIGVLDDSQVATRAVGILEANIWDTPRIYEVSSINYYIRPSILTYCGQAWFDAIVEGSGEWNDITNCKINLIRVYNESSADIVWGSDNDTGMPSSHQNLGSNAIARSTFPSGGKVGDYIAVSASATSFYWGSKLKTAMHEIGHCFGLRHTASNDGQQIHTTPWQESGSIMYQGSNTNPSFQDGDLRALRMYYPSSLQKPTNVSAVKASSGSVRMTFKNTQGDAKPWYWVRVFKYSSSGQYLSSKYFKSYNINSNDNAVTWSGHGSGTFKFSMRAYNFRRDLSSALTSRYTVTL